MKKDLTIPPQEIRERIILFLLFFSSEKCLKAYHHFMPPEALAYELSRVWFEELYAPSTRYLNSLKGDFSEEKALEFQQCFTEEELERLERFHRFWELRIDMLADKHKNHKVFPKNDSWKQLVKDAAYLVKFLEPEAQQRRVHLEKMMQNSIKENAQLTERKWSQLLIGGGGNPEHREKEGSQ